MTLEESLEPRTRWPWLVSVGGHCAGTLIGPRWVVTAANCCTDPSKIKFIGPNILLMLLS